MNKHITFGQHGWVGFYWDINKWDTPYIGVHVWNDEFNRKGFAITISILCAELHTGRTW